VTFIRPVRGGVEADWIGPILFVRKAFEGGEVWIGCQTSHPPER